MNLTRTLLNNYICKMTLNKKSKFYTLFWIGKASHMPNLFQYNNYVESLEIKN